ncbi:IPT/TIG domain-containing protein [Cryobacterium melibiosiphilum]|nr:IPT/TIG domain-containing protein [Cryobacterium melibiosiphilum]
MTVDASGNDLSAVGIPITGFLGFAPKGTVFPTSTEGAASTFTLPIAFVKAGLLTEDGGFEWTLEPDGDPIKFYQDGYQIPSGLANATLVVKLAQYDAMVRELSYGKTADANGYLTIDAGGHAVEYVAFTEEIFKSGAIRRRIAEVSVTGAKVDKSERGAVNGTELTCAAKRSASLGNDHIGEWWLPASSGTAPTVTAASPSGAATAATVTITGTGFTGATAVKFGAANATSFNVVSSTSITAVMPSGTSGSAEITVTTAYGTSNSFAYTRAA